MHGQKAIAADVCLLESLRSKLTNQSGNLVQHFTQIVHKSDFDTICLVHSVGKHTIYLVLDELVRS